MTTKTMLLIALVLFSTVASATTYHQWQGRVNWGPGGDHATITASGWEGYYTSVTVYDKGEWETPLYSGSVIDCIVVATLYDANDNVIDSRSASADQYVYFGGVYTWTHLFDFTTVEIP